MGNHNPKDSELIAKMGADQEIQKLAHQLFLASCRYKYSYNFSWLGRPIIQYPQDMIAMQELIYQVQPDLIVETGIAHGGSLIFYASILQLIGGEGQILGLDIDIRPHNKVEIEKHRMSKRIKMIQGSSIDDGVAQQVYAAAKGKKRIMVILDSNHTHAHVKRELELYSKLVTKDSYLVVFDTVVEDMSKEFFPDRPWDVGDNPKTAVREFLKTNDRFVMDKEVENKLLLTVAPEGYLKCVKD